MAAPQQVPDAFKDRQRARTISGARNIAITEKKTAANDNNTNDVTNITFKRRPDTNIRIAQNDNGTFSASWEKSIINKLDDYDIDDLEELLELYGEKLNEKTRGLIGKALLARKYYKVSILNWSILGWGMTLWLIQFKLALISLATIGVVGALDYVERNSIVGKFFINGGGKLFDSFLEALSVLIGTEIDFDPTSVMMLTILITFLFGLSTLLIMSFLYQITFVNCFMGKGADLKMSLFIFAIFGYFTPILNLFPWFILWLLAVWRYPK